MARQVINRGNFPNDHAHADSIYVINGKINDMTADIYARLSRTISVGEDRFSAGSTTEAKADLAIAQALLELAYYVEFPAFMLPYDITLLNQANLTAFAAVGGRLTREGGPVNLYDVRAYGASPIGPDVSAGIQAAEAAAETQVGTVFFDDGIYRCKNITINTSGVRWVGSPSAELRFPASGVVAGDALVLINTNYTTTDLADVSIEGLGFNGDDQQVSAVKGIYARRTQRLGVTRCRFRKFQGASFPQAAYCIYASGYSASQPASPYAWGSSAPAGWSVGTRIQHCTFTDCGASNVHTAESIFLYYHDGALVQGNYAQNTAKLIFVDGWCRRVSILGNEIEDQFDSGIRLQGDDAIAGTLPSDCQDNTISGNVIRNVVKDCIRYSAARGTITGNVCERALLSGIAAVVAIDTLISNNQCFDNGNCGIQLVRTTITGWGAHSHVTVLGNECLGNAGFGIQAEGGGDTSSVAMTGIAIHANRCGRNGNDGIRMSDADDTCRITDNTSYENGDGVQTVPAGIRVISTLVNSGGVLIARNRCFEKRTGGSQRQVIGVYLTAGTGTTLSQCYIKDNDLSDHQNITVPGGQTGRPIRTTGSAGTANGHLIVGNSDRNCATNIRTGVNGGSLQSTDVILAADAVVSESYVTLTDGSTIAVNAALGNVFEVTLGGNRTMNAPGNTYKGQRLTFHIIQDGTGGRTLAWNAAYGQAWSDTGNTLGKRCTVVFEVYNSITPSLVQVGTQGPYV